MYMLLLLYIYIYIPLLVRLVPLLCELHGNCITSTCGSFPIGLTSNWARF